MVFINLHHRSLEKAPTSICCAFDRWTRTIVLCALVLLPGCASTLPKTEFTLIKVVFAIVVMGLVASSAIPISMPDHISARPEDLRTLITGLIETYELLYNDYLLNEFIKNYIDMPNKLVDLLIRFLNQNNGTLSKRAKKREFEKLTASEINAIELKYSEIFG